MQASPQVAAGGRPASCRQSTSRPPFGAWASANSAASDAALKSPPTSAALRRRPGQFRHDGFELPAAERLCVGQMRQMQGDRQNGA